LDGALDVLNAWSEEEAVWPLYLKALQVRAINARTLGDFAKARRSLEQAARLADARAGEESYEAASVANAFGVLEKLAGHYAEATKHYQRCMSLLEALGEPIPATLWHNLAGLACETGDLDDAEAYARRAIAQRSTNTLSLELGTDWAGLGDALLLRGQLDEAVGCYQRALRIYAEVGHGDHPEVAYALHNLADAEADRGNLDEAAGLYRQTITRKIKLFGSIHHEVAASSNNLSVLESRRGHHPADQACLLHTSDAAADKPGLPPR